MHAKNSNLPFDEEFRTVLTTDRDCIKKGKVYYFEAAENDHFKKGNYLSAFLKYSKAAKVCDHAKKALEMMIHISLEKGDKGPEARKILHDFKDLYVNQYDFEDIKVKLRDIEETDLSPNSDRFLIEHIETYDPRHPGRTEQELRNQTQHCFIIKRCLLVYLDLSQ